MSVKTRISAGAFGLALTVGAAAGCGGAETAEGPATPAAVQLSPQNVATAVVAELVSGPLVSGQLTPAREAAVRAQVGGSIVALSVDRGQAVNAGQVIARLSSRDLDEAFSSAQAAVRSAETALTVAQSEAQRTESLVKGGALAARDLEQARNAVANAEAQLAAARAREKGVWQQRDDTVIRAPFGGVVSERAANIGDVVAPGAAIATIIDPSSLRLEALVPSDQIAQVQPGASVRFNIRGLPGQTVIGQVERISPTADPITRQVPLFVSLPNVDGKLIAGLFAEGRVDASRRVGIVVPQAALDETGPVPTVTRIRGGKAERVAVQLGLRQAETEQVEILSPLAAGDVVILGSAKGVAPGTPVTITK
jgi:RND family efflux transporter MFP subunit